ncbi:hypothetical protein AMATHDRAFT_66633 [Amanita thiersii Skay4041]|uniref:COQ9 C-terminal domain-containing protein n=1 Tax=Amanita thiersii Skay4041 TaxID=703135 RepID=A0A2A9NB50_9AGAR|nr:hypothetical protein AMATHDRAFT_66633 [Amanita thiersii Skay4041]
MATAIPLRTQLLRLALPLVRTHGFTREALSQAAVGLPNHVQPLPDSAVSSLFGDGDEARRTLIRAWLDEGVEGIKELRRRREVLERMELDMRLQQQQETQPKAPFSQVQTQPLESERIDIRHVLRARLAYNEPVLAYLPEAFALLASPVSGLPPLDPTPALNHAATVASEACYAAGEKTILMDWYTRRATIAAIYTAAELHQLVSPPTASAFLDTLLAESKSLGKKLDDVGSYSNYIFRSWAGILKSSGAF